MLYIEHFMEFSLTFRAIQLVKPCQINNFFLTMDSMVGQSQEQDWIFYQGRDLDFKK